ncbi:mechanosensitive ion channel domain-containing protein [Ferrimonas sp. SCSIO 43195]|uniref:mechanosensitive ion channel domain-containing protein n=1 Tax=Ferrimonas sp. SCSIO 43195 TaxID=2822844 RepID=UPI002075D345|nr:mechanosensitive ion channel domain-containing protein [Ferrimonas sp. SCSIO 43195]USD37104.1 mechanosensitive ion channel [Ferrimonas sp. SCSIO 43195]
MWRILSFCLTLLVISSVTAAPFSLEKKLTPASDSSQPLTPAQWQQATAVEIQRAHGFQRQLDDFAVLQQQILSQLQSPAQPQVDPTQPLSQQLSLAHNLLQEFKSSFDALGDKVDQLRHRLDAIKQELQQAEGQQQLASDTPNVMPERLEYLQQWQQSLNLEQQSRPLELKLTQLRQQLVRAQLLAQERLIEALNQQANQQRRQQSERALNDSSQAVSSNPALQQLNDTNANLARQLASVNTTTETLVQQQQLLEQHYQKQRQRLKEIKEQFEWMTRDATFGASLLKRLRQLERQQQSPVLDHDISRSRVQKFDIEQRQADMEYQLRQYPTDERAPLWQQQLTLLNQLQSALEQQVVELSRLNQLRHEAEQLEDKLVQLISERMFWLPNAQSIDTSWFSQVIGSVHWLLTTDRWQELSRAIDDNSDWWSVWLVAMVLTLVLQDLLRGPYAQLRQHQARYVGNVTHDRFSASFKSLMAAMAYSLIIPAPLIAAAWKLQQQVQLPFTHAIGSGLLAGVLLLYLFWLFHQLSRPDGLFIAHFRRHPPLVQRNIAFFKQLLFTSAPLLMLVRFCQESEVPLLSNSLGRAAFLLFCAVLAYAYWKLIKIVDEYHIYHTKTRPNQHLLERLVWLALILVPLVALVLTVQGYYFTAFSVLTQVQLTVLLAIGFMLAHLMIKRWMLIQRRRLAFERAKAKRAEVLAQREKERNEPGNDPLEPLEDPQIDLDTISTQSLGLVRSLMILAFILTLLGVWSQTHPAVFSSLDGIVLWTSNEVIGGIEQAVPITLQSILAGGLILGFTLMTARNLPGMLELVILQRLELSPGTGFAITTISRYMVLLIGTISAFSTLGLAWSKLQWLVAALSVGLGFGLQEIFANFISGLIILFEKPIRIGDTVTIRDLTGNVSKIQTRATTIVDWDCKEIIVPNKAFITEQLINWSLSDAITRVTIKVGVSRDSDPALVEALLHQAVKETPHALAQPEPEIYFAGFGSHTQDYEIRVYTDEMGKRWPLRHRLHQLIIKKFRESKVDMAYPQMEIQLKSKAEMVDNSGNLIR